MKFGSTITKKKKEKKNLLQNDTNKKYPKEELYKLCRENHNHQYPKIKQKFKSQKNIQFLKVNMLIPLCNPSLSVQSAPIPVKPNKTIISITNSASSNNRVTTQRKTISAFEARISLIFALASQSASVSQRRKCYYYLFIIFYRILSFDLVFTWCSCCWCGYRDCKVFVSEKIWKPHSRRSVDDRCFIFLLNYATNFYYYRIESVFLINWI